MSFRIEDKLYIKSENLLQFYEFLFKHSVKKLFNSRKIKSLYFDNLKLEMYKDSIEGSVPRKKIRIREYPNTHDNKYYLETKVSSIEGRYKTREIINEEKNSSLEKFGFLDKDYGTCLPKLYVSYEREYFLFKDVRVSIDRKISYTSYTTKQSVNDLNTIVELKTSYNKNLDDLIKMFPFQRIRFSKYCLAIEKLI